MNPRNLAKQGEGGMGDDAEVEDIYNVKLKKKLKASFYQLEAGRGESMRTHLTKGIRSSKFS